jgi:hypothetical protein
MLDISLSLKNSKHHPIGTPSGEDFFTFPRQAQARKFKT